MKKVLLLLLSVHLHSYELGVVSMFRDEAPYLREWIEYHRLVGVDHFWLYNDRSVDDYMLVLQPYIDEGLVELFPWDVPPDATSYVPTQIAAFQDGISRAVGMAKWVAMIDIDEFIVPMKQDTIPSCLDRHYSDASAVFVNWLNFGTSRVKLIANEPILCHLTACSDGAHWYDRVGKSIVRPEQVDVKAIWYPHHFVLKEEAYYRDGQKRKLPFHGTTLATKGNAGYQYLCIHHYCLRDENFFWNVRVAKAKRGIGNLNQLYDQYSSFTKRYDYRIIELIKKLSPELYVTLWNQGRRLPSSSSVFPEGGDEEHE